MSEAVTSAACSSSRDGFRVPTSEPVAPQSTANPLSSGLETYANPPSPTKRRATLEPETPVAKRIKVEPSDDTSLPNPEPAETSIPRPVAVMMTPALPAAPALAPTAAPSVAPTTTTASIPPTTPAMTAATATMTSSAPSPQIGTSAPAPAPAPALAASSTAPIPSIEKSPSVKPEPAKDMSTPNSVKKDNATPETQVANAGRPATATAVPPRKRRRMAEAPGQALRGMNMQLLGIQAVQVLEWLSQEPFEDVVDALRDVDSEVYASYSFKVAQFEQAWRNFSPTEDLLVWSKMGLGDQKHRKTLRLANLARFAIDLFSEDESYLPSLHDRFFRVFVYGTREFIIDHSNILLELKTQLALHLLTESDETKAPAVILQEVMLDGLEEGLSERSWNLGKSDEEAAMLTSAEIRMSLLLQEYEESGNSATTLADRYPPDNLLRQVGSYMHRELDAHSDHCQTLVFSSRTSGNRLDEPRSLAYQDDDDYWQRTTNIIDEIVASVTADIGAEGAPAASGMPVPATSTQPSATPNGTTQSEPVDAIQQSATPATPAAPGASATPAGPVAPAAPAAPAIEPGEMNRQLRGDIDRLKEFMNQKVAVLEAEMARASLLAAPPPTPAPLDQTAQNLYLLNKATQSQQPQYTQRTSATPQPRTHTPTGSTPHTPIPGHPQGHVPHLPHPTGGAAPNHTPGPGQPSNPPLAPGELPPHQTCPTSMLYDKARQAALSKSATHTRREGIHSTRRPWTPEEEKALMTGLDMVKGPHWSQILSLFGPNGTISDVLKDRTQVQLKDKARNLKLFFLKTQSEMPYYLSAVTGELKTRAPNQAARKEAEERARLSREEDQSKAQGNLAALAGQLHNSNLSHGNQGGAMRQQHHTGMVTPAQAALAAQITTPAMAQGQAQSAQRPLHAAQFPTSIAQTKEAHTTTTTTPVSGPMAAPTSTSTSTSVQGGTIPAPAPHSQPHNRPNDGTVAALQELAKASASPAPGTHTPRMSHQMSAPGQGQAQGASAGAYHVNQGHAAHGQSHHPIARQPQPRAQMPAQPQGQPHSQTRYSASPGLSAYAPTPSVTTPAASTAKSTPTSDVGPTTTQAQAPTATTTAGPTHTPTARPQGLSTSGPPPRAQPPSSSTSTSASIPATSALAQLQHSRSTPMTLSQSFPSTIPASLFSRVTEAEATNAGLLEKLRAEMAREARS